MRVRQHPRAPGVCRAACVLSLCGAAAGSACDRQPAGGASASGAVRARDTAPLLRPRASATFDPTPDGAVLVTDRCEPGVDDARDTSDAEALAPGSGWVRDSPTELRFRPTRGAPLVWVDDTTQGETYRRHHVIGPLPGTDYAVLRRTYYETGDYVLVHAPTGDTLAVDGAPVLSPDGRRVVAARADLFAGNGDSGLEVVALTPDGPRREFSRTTASADRAGGWAPTAVRWAGDTVRFGRAVAVDTPPGHCRVTPARLVRTAAGWAVQEVTR